MANDICGSRLVKVETQTRLKSFSLSSLSCHFVFCIPSLTSLQFLVRTQSYLTDDLVADAVFLVNKAFNIYIINSGYIFCVSPHCEPQSFHSCRKSFFLNLINFVLTFFIINGSLISTSYMKITNQKLKAPKIPYLQNVPPSQIL